MANRVRDLSGIKVGKLTVTSFSGLDEWNRALWECRCECGRVVVRRSQVISDAINKGKASHCGCSPSLKTHGLTKGNQRLYWVWSSMIQRCENQNNKDYSSYGGRGISVCSEWRDSFPDFHAWALSSGYREGLTIERVDVDDGYHPDNCTWIENNRQCLNQRDSQYITFRGKTQHLSDWSRETGIKYRTLRARMFVYGWSVERSLTEEPVIGKNQHG